MAKHRAVAIASVWVLAALCLGAAGCRTMAPTSPPAETVVQTPTPWNPTLYAEFVADNMAQLNRYYSDEYAPCVFVVDTSRGSAVIQTLMAFDRAAGLIEMLDVQHLSDAHKTSVILDYVQSHYAYRLAPNHWVSTAEVVDNGRGDCKGLSLLLFTLLEAAGIRTYAAISNGHMWVNAYYDDHWHVLETDTDTERNRIYRLAGFYDKPLYKVYTDQTMKRIPLEPSTQ